MAEIKCENCGATDAVVHLTQIVNNEMSTHHLCQTCAAAKGLHDSPDPSNEQLLDLIEKVSPNIAGLSRTGTEQCAFCGLTFDDFRKTTRLGCPQCYEAFSDHLPRLLRRIHGGVKHVGKVYLPPDPTASEMEKRLEGLRRKLERAVQSEDFERAAEIRDEIRASEPA
jgi:protein arginine kinase activator